MSSEEKRTQPNNVILDDLDRIEAEREVLRGKLSLKHLFFPGREGDLTLWRRLFSFARPYVVKITFCLFLSTILGGMTAGKLWFVKAGLEPMMVNPAGLIEEAKDNLADKLDGLGKDAGSAGVNILDYDTVVSENFDWNSVLGD